MIGKEPAVPPQQNPEQALENMTEVEKKLKTQLFELLAVRYGLSSELAQPKIEYLIDNLGTLKQLMIQTGYTHYGVPPHRLPVALKEKLNELGRRFLDGSTNQPIGDGPYAYLNVGLNLAKTLVLEPSSTEVANWMNFLMEI